MLVLSLPCPQSRMEVVYEGRLICSSPPPPTREMRSCEPWADMAALSLRTSASSAVGGAGWEPSPQLAGPSSQVQPLH